MALAVLSLSIVLAGAPPQTESPQNPPGEKTDLSGDPALDPASEPGPAPETEPPSDESAEPAETSEGGPEVQQPTSTAAPEAPADTPETTPAAPDPASDPTPGGSDMSTLLESDEDQAPRVRIRVDDSARAGVDQRERMRDYYARVYRPSHNPSRLYFGARAAFGLADSQDGAGGRAGFVSAEIGQTWNKISYALGPTLFAGSIDIGGVDDNRYSPVLVGGGPSLGLGRLSLVGRGYVDLRVGYNFFYAPVSTTDPSEGSPAAAAPHGPKAQVDMGLLFHDSERRRFRHGLGATLGWQMLVHSLAGDFPIVNSFNIGVSYFFG